MPWKECSVVDERLRFVAQLLDGEAMSEVCRAFGISHKTGYKISRLPRGPFRSGVWSTHVVLGLILALVLAMRILWRAGFGNALPPADTGVLRWVAKGTHHALYLLLLAVVVLGIANASYRGCDLYGVLTVPRFGNGDPAIERSINTLHEWAANLVVLIALCHAAAALGHQYIWRDRLLQRMRPRL